MNLLSSVYYQYLKENLLKLNPDFENIDIEKRTFPDGEHYWRIENSQDISGKPAIYVCGTINDEAILEAYNVACTLVRESCSSLHLVIPYFGYSTMERAVQSGEIVTAKNIAQLFSSIPPSANGNYIYMIDLHSTNMQYYFGENVHPIHLTTEPLIYKIISDIRSKEGGVVLASADTGCAKWIEKMSDHMGVEAAFIVKQRISASETVVKALKANVKGKNIIIFDDMIRSGGTIINAAKAYKAMGAKDVFVICVHGILIHGAVEKLKDSGVIKKLYCSNTHPHAQNIHDDFVKVCDVSDIILKGLKI